MKNATDFSMVMSEKKKPGHAGAVAALAAVAVVVTFLLPLLPLKLAPTVWYPYTSSPNGYGSLTYRYSGYGATFWSPNHYWIYFGSYAVQVVNSSASTITVNSIDQNGTAIFGYYTIVSDSGGKVIATGYTSVSFSTIAGARYTVQEEGYGRCTFSHWSSGVTSSELSVLARSGDLTITAVFDC